MSGREGLGSGLQLALGGVTWGHRREGRELVLTQVAVESGCPGQRAFVGLRSGSGCPDRRAGTWVLGPPASWEVGRLIGGPSGHKRVGPTPWGGGEGAEVA